jgi:hypothetical protein
MSTEVQRQTIMGTRKDGQKLTTISADDPFKDSPFYSAGDVDNENINPIPEGGVLAGYFHGLRESRKANSSGSKSWYACMETVDGEKFRVFAPTQLRNVLEREARLKQYVELTYMGRKEPIDGGRPYHNFEVALGDILN